MKMSKKHFGVLQLFLQSLLCLQKLHEQSLLKILLPATNSNNNTSYKRVQILTQNLHQSVAILPLMQEMLLSEFFAGSGISSKMLFMQPSKAKKTLQKELQNNKCFFTLFCPSLSSYNTCKCNLGQVGRKTTWCFATLSAKFCLHSKAAKTPCCWKCCCQQQNEPINLLAKGGAISTRNSGPKCSIGPPRARNFIVSACCW